MALDEQSYDKIHAAILDASEYFEQLLEFRGRPLWYRQVLAELATFTDGGDIAFVDVDIDIVNEDRYEARLYVLTADLVALVEVAVEGAEQHTTTVRPRSALRSLRLDAPIGASSTNDAPGALTVTLDYGDAVIALPAHPQNLGRHRKIALMVPSFAADLQRP
jgi:hypothetical protein